MMGGMQQILCGHLQALCKLQSHQLMSNTAFLQVGTGLGWGGWAVG